MKHRIRLIKNRYWVFTIDRYGNIYDTMRDFASKAEALAFVKIDRASIGALNEAN